MTAFTTGAGPQDGSVQAPSGGPGMVPIGRAARGAQA